MNRTHRRVGWSAVALACVALAVPSARAEEPPTPDTPPATTAPAQDASRRAGGDPSHVEFTLPFADALAKAKAENRLLFVKPVYGGVDGEGARDYRCGSW